MVSSILGKLKTDIDAQKTVARVSSALAAFSLSALAAVVAPDKGAAFGSVCGIAAVFAIISECTFRPAIEEGWFLQSRPNIRKKVNSRAIRVAPGKTRSIN